MLPRITMAHRKRDGCPTQARSVHEALMRALAGVDHVSTTLSVLVLPLVKHKLSGTSSSTCDETTAPMRRSQEWT